MGERIISGERYRAGKPADHGDAGFDVDHVENAKLT
jgi:hypothetical protein